MIGLDAIPRKILRDVVTAIPAVRVAARVNGIQRSVRSTAKVVIAIPEAKRKIETVVNLTRGVGNLVNQVTRQSMSDWELE